MTDHPTFPLSVKDEERKIVTHCFAVALRLWMQPESVQKWIEARLEGPDIHDHIQAGMYEAPGGSQLYLLQFPSGEVIVEPVAEQLVEEVLRKAFDLSSDFLHPILEPWQLLKITLCTGQILYWLRPIDLDMTLLHLV